MWDLSMSQHSGPVSERSRSTPHRQHCLPVMAHIGTSVRTRRVDGGPSVGRTSLLSPVGRPPAPRALCAVPPEGPSEHEGVGRRACAHALAATNTRESPGDRSTDDRSVTVSGQGSDREGLTSSLPLPLASRLRWVRRRRRRRACGSASTSQQHARKDIPGQDWSGANQHNPPGSTRALVRKHALLRRPTDRGWSVGSPCAHTHSQFEDRLRSRTPQGWPLMRCFTGCNSLAAE